MLAWLCLEQGADMHMVVLDKGPLNGCVCVLLLTATYAFSALALLVGHQEDHPDCKNGVMTC